MKAFIASPLMRGALLLSILLHLGVLAAIGARQAPVTEPDVESLRLVQVDPSLPKPLPPPYAPAERAAPLPPPPARPPAYVKRRPSPLKRPPARRRPARPPRRESPRSAAPAKSSPAPVLGRRTGTRKTASATPRGPFPPTTKTAKTPSAPSPADNLTASDDEEEVPEGPTALEPVGGEEDAAQLSPLTKGAMVAANTRNPGEVNAAFVRQKVFGGPGVFYTVTLNVPASAPPGAVYQLELTDVVLADSEAKPVSFTPVSGTLTLLPTKAPLPPDEQPTLTGNHIGVGRLYAHRGTKIAVEVFAGEAIQNLMGAQARLVYRAVKLPTKRRQNAPPTPTSGGSGSTPAASSPTPSSPSSSQPSPSQPSPSPPPGSSTATASSTLPQPDASSAKELPPAQPSPP